MHWSSGRHLLTDPQTTPFLGHLQAMILNAMFPSRIIAMTHASLTVSARTGPFPISSAGPYRESVHWPIQKYHQSAWMYRKIVQSG